MRVARRLSVVFLLGSLFAGAATAQLAGPTRDASGIEWAKALIVNGELESAQTQLLALRVANPNDVETLFLLGVVARARSDLDTAIARFREALDRDPGATRIRLELAYALFLAKRDEAADYHFKMAITDRLPYPVLQNIVSLRDAIRNRRSWRFNLTFGFAPDSNINAASNDDEIEIFGLPFQVDPEARARSGIGIVAGVDASARLLRQSRVPIYLAAYGRMLGYQDRRFNDAYVGGEVGPEFRVRGGRLRVAATGLQRWYGGKTLINSGGGRLNFETLLGGKTAVEASIGARRNFYARRSDVDGWDFDASLAANRALGASTIGFGYTRLQRSIANDPGQSSWQVTVGAGAMKEIGWGLRPQLSVEAGRQINDAQLFPFGRYRRDWRVEVAASIYKRDWQIAGLAPSIRLSQSRNISTIDVYDQKRLRAEFGLTKAF